MPELFNWYFDLNGYTKVEYKNERIQDLAYYIKTRSPNFDVFLITELWMRKDHQILTNAANEANLYMTKFSEFNGWW
jgi:hypothetical protein